MTGNTLEEMADITVKDFCAFIHNEERFIHKAHELKEKTNDGRNETERFIFSFRLLDRVGRRRPPRVVATEELPSKGPNRPPAGLRR